MVNRWHVAIPFILLLGTAWIWISRPSIVESTFDTPQPALYHPAPDFTLPRLNTSGAAGEEFSLSAAKGRPIVLNFWATWCGPCRREFPALQAAAARHGACVAPGATDGENQGDTGDHVSGSDCVLFLGVNQGETADTVARFLSEVGSPASGNGRLLVEQSDGASGLEIILDRSLEVGQRYNVQGLPLTFFIDAEGIIRGVWSGEMNSVILAERIAEILP